MMQTKDNLYENIRESTARGVLNTQALRLKSLNSTTAVVTYTQNSSKEQLCLEYVLNFYTQFQKLFPNRTSMFIAPHNEFNVPKFVSTTLRPTLLPYKEEYDYQNCAKLVSRLIEYEPLADPRSFPTCLPSPSTVLSWQKGNCFDLSMVLASFLIGNGYDAYVVSGYAPKWICLQDQSETLCPLLDQKEVEEWQNQVHHEAIEVDEKIDNFRPIPRAEIKSKYVAMQEQKEADRISQLLKFEEIDFGEEPQVDEHEGRRVHSWVLIRAGKRDVENHFFLESSTGRAFQFADSPYESIESVWNHQNYFINMQTPSKLRELNLDFENATDWEYIFLDHSNAIHSAKTDAPSRPETTKVEAKDDNAVQENILDLPKSWVQKLIIPRDVYLMKFCGGGESTTLYKKSILEEFADNVHQMGIISRLTLFKDIERCIPIEVRETFKNRKDHLESRLRFPLLGKMHESFSPGRHPEALKDRIEFSGRRREFHFYTGARTDGLVRREEVLNRKMMEYYDGRDDALIYRSVTLTLDRDPLHAGKNTLTIPTNGPHGDLAIMKMAEKYYHDDTMDEDEVPQKRSYLVIDGIIKVKYHYAPGKISACTRVFNKAQPSNVEIINMDPAVGRPKDSLLQRAFLKAVQREKDCHAAIRACELASHEILSVRQKEESNIVLQKSIFDKAQENASEEKTMHHTADDEKESADRELDYLTPFLHHVKNVKKHITADEANRARDLCLKALKDRLLERANIIQSRLDDENAQLAKRQAAFQRSHRENENATDRDFEKFCSEAMFRISILEQRLTRHEETALQKYSDLDGTLHRDQRLAAAFAAYKSLSRE